MAPYAIPSEDRRRSSRIWYHARARCARELQRPRLRTAPLEPPGADGSSATYAWGDYSPAEQQLAHLTDQCAEIVRRWGATSERHARAVSRFETHLTEWNEAGTRLQEDASQRIKEMEKVIQQEWGELRDLQDGPVRQLHEHATSLTQVCIATATAAQQNFERSEARLAAIEHEFNRRMTELTREIQAVVAELRALHQSPAGQLAAAAPAWPLEGVTRLHSQLRQSDATGPGH